MKLDKAHKLHKAVKKDSGRCAMNGARYRSSALFLDRKGGEPIYAPALEVTDGKILARVPVEPYELEGFEPDTDGALVPREALEAAARVKAPHALLHVNGTAELIATTRSGAPDLAGPRSSFPLLDGEFPRTDSVIPAAADLEGRTRFGLNVRLLVALAEALGSDTLQLVLPERNEEGKLAGQIVGAVVAFPLDGGAGFGVIMPFGFQE